MKGNNITNKCHIANNNLYTCLYVHIIYTKPNKVHKKKCKTDGSKYKKAMSSQRELSNSNKYIWTHQAFVYTCICLTYIYFEHIYVYVFNILQPCISPMMFYYVCRIFVESAGSQAQRSACKWNGNRVGFSRDEWMSFGMRITDIERK